MLSNRKKVLQTLSFLGLSASLGAIEPISRVNPRIKGLSLAAYSLRDKMKWFKGKPGKGSMDMLDFLEFTAQHQFSAAELTAYFFPEPLNKPYLNQIKRRAHLLGLDLSGGAIGNNFSYAPNSDMGKQQMHYTKTWIDNYADMGIPVIRIFAGKKPKQINEVDMMDHLKSNLEEALMHAEKRGVILGMENHDSMTYIDKLIGFIKTVQSPYFGVTWDSANITTDGDPYTELEKLAPYTVNAQVKAKIPHHGEEVDTDFQKIISILKRANYAGYITLEYEEKEDPFIEIPKFKAKIEPFI